MAALVAGAVTPIAILTILGVRPDPPQLPESEEWAAVPEPPTLLLGSGPVPNAPPPAKDAPAAPIPAVVEGTDEVEPDTEVAVAPEPVPLRQVALHPALTPMPVAPVPVVEDEDGLPQALSEDRVVMRIHTVPPGATIEMDGRSRGRSPVKLMVNPGDHTLFVDAGDGVKGQFRVEASSDLRLCYATSEQTLQPVDCGDLLGR